MTQDRAARFLSGARGDLSRHDDTDPTELILAFRARMHHHLPVARPRSLRHDDNRREIAAIRTGLKSSGDFFVIEWDLGNQNDMRAAGDPAVQSDPAR